MSGVPEAVLIEPVRLLPDGMLLCGILSRLRVVGGGVAVRPTEGVLLFSLTLTESAVDYVIAILACAPGNLLILSGLRISPLLMN